MGNLTHNMTSKLYRTSGVLLLIGLMLVAGLLVTGTISADIGAQDSRVDESEPNDDLSTANTIEANTTVDGEVNDSNDTDVFGTAIEAGQNYTVTFTLGSTASGVTNFSLGGRFPTARASN